MYLKDIIKMAHNYGGLYESSLSDVYSEESLLKEIKDNLILNGVSFVSVSSNALSKKTSTDATIWSGGFVTDNFETYYLDKNMVKHYS
jgi:hypothetical protein